jgi:hypothetical protein
MTAAATWSLLAWTTPSGVSVRLPALLSLRLLAISDFVPMYSTTCSMILHCLLMRSHPRSCWWLIPTNTSTPIMLLLLPVSALQCLKLTGASLCSLLLIIQELRFVTQMANGT